MDSKKFKGDKRMGWFSSKSKRTDSPAVPKEASLKPAVPTPGGNAQEEIIHELIRASKTSMGFMGKSSTKAAAELLLSNETPVHAILTNVTLGDPAAKEAFNAKGFKDKTNVVLIITDQRLVLAGALGTPVSKAIALADIHTIDNSNVTSVVHSVLRGESADTILAIDGNKQVLTTFCDRLKAAVRQAKKKC